MLYRRVDGKILKIYVCGKNFFLNLTFWNNYVKKINTVVPVFSTDR